MDGVARDAFRVIGGVQGQRLGILQPCPFATSSNGWPSAAGGATPEADGVATIASTVNMATIVYAWIDGGAS